MARTLLTPVSLKGAYEPSATALAVANFVAADTGDGNAFVATGREIVLAKNTQTATPVTEEQVKAGDTLANIEITQTLVGLPEPGSLVIDDSSTPPQIVRDDGNGKLVGDVGTGGTNTVDYTTGDLSFSFAKDSTGPADADYVTGTSKTVTVTSVVNDKNRTGDITARKIGAGEIVVLPFFKLDGWMQTDGSIYLNGQDAAVEFCVLRLPV